IHFVVRVSGGAWLLRESHVSDVPAEWVSCAGSGRARGKHPPGTIPDGSNSTCIGKSTCSYFAVYIDYEVFKATQLTKRACAKLVNKLSFYLCLRSMYC